jgi:hypothetical protein
MYTRTKQQLKLKEEGGFKTNNKYTSNPTSGNSFPNYTSLTVSVKLKLTTTNLRVYHVKNPVIKKTDGSNKLIWQIQMLLLL